MDTPRPLRLLGAGKSQITGGDKGVIVNMSLPVTWKRGAVLFQCPNVFIHLADVGDKILLGFPLFRQYRLAFLPNQRFLVPTEELKMVKYPSRYQGLCPKCRGDQKACPCVHQHVLVIILKQHGHGQPVLENKSVYLLTYNLYASQNRWSQIGGALSVIQQHHLRHYLHVRIMDMLYA